MAFRPNRLLPEPSLLNNLLISFFRSHSHWKRIYITQRIHFHLLTMATLDVVNGLFLWKWHICSLSFANTLSPVSLSRYLYTHTQTGSKLVERDREKETIFCHWVLATLSSVFHFPKFAYLFRSFLSIVKCKIVVKRSKQCERQQGRDWQNVYRVTIRVSGWFCSNIYLHCSEWKHTKVKRNACTNISYCDLN